MAETPTKPPEHPALAWIRWGALLLLVVIQWITSGKTGSITIPPLPQPQPSPSPSFVVFYADRPGAGAVGPVALDKK